MKELIQRHTVVDMVVAQTGTSPSYAVLKIHNAIKNGKLKAYERKLKWGTGTMNLFDPDEVQKWLDTPVKIGRPFKNKIPIDKL